MLIKTSSHFKRLLSPGSIFPKQHLLHYFCVRLEHKEKTKSFQHTFKSADIDFLSVLFLLLTISALYRALLMNFFSDVRISLNPQKTAPADHVCLRTNLFKLSKFFLSLFEK